MRLIKIILIIILAYFLIRAIPLLFVYKDALFKADSKKELIGKLIYDSRAYEGDIVIIKLPERKRMVIPNEIYKYAVSPSSYDGEHIMFIGKDDAVYTIDSDGRNLKRLLKLSWDEQIEKCSYSPDGQKFAFITRNGLYIADVNMPYFYRKILDMPVANQPTWSPDGRKLAVVTGKMVPAKIEAMGKTYGGWMFAGDILTLNIDGTDVRKLVRGYVPSWSPDGKKIAYQGMDGYYIIDANDTNGSTKKFISSTYHPVFKGGVSVCPRWSPDGKFITVGKKLWFYHDGIYAVSVDNPKKMLWIAAATDNMSGMSWVK